RDRGEILMDERGKRVRITRTDARDQRRFMLALETVPFFVGRRRNVRRIGVGRGHDDVISAESTKRWRTPVNIMRPWDECAMPSQLSDTSCDGTAMGQEQLYNVRAFTRALLQAASHSIG